jgi:spermidine synthase
MRRTVVISACFFLSGATALIYEVLWVRMLALTFGNTVYAIGVVLTAFMSGLCLGSFVFGRWADKRANILKLYGILEFCIAGSALASPLILESITSVYLSLSPQSMPISKLLETRYVLSILVLIVPTTFMGGTLPILSRYFIHTEDDLERRIGALYSLNTIGGIFGTFLVGFFMIRLFGMSFTLKAAVVLNVAVGVVSYYMGMRQSVAVVRESEPPKKRGRGYRYALFAFSLAGFSSMVYQVAWTRLLISVLGSATYSFSLILMGFLLGIGLGSLAVSYISRRRRLDFAHFSLLEISIGVAGLCTVAFFNLFPSLVLKGIILAGSYYNTLAVEFALIVLYVAVPTTMMGAAFPIIACVYSDGPDKTGRNIGNIYAANTLGAVAGSALAAFLFLPVVGTVGSIKLAAFINILVGVSGLLVIGRYRTFALVSVLMLLPFAPVDIPAKLLHTGVAIYGAGKGQDYFINPPDRFDLFVKEGPNATISVSAFYDGLINLATNGKTDASTEDDMSTQLALGYFPTLIHPEPKDVLVIGFGTGVTVRAALDIPEVREVDCVEIEPAVLEAAHYFESVNKGVHRNPRARYFIDDARSHIISSRKEYDVIISEPSNPWINGIGNLFTKEFYEISLSRLREGGIFAQWVQLYSLSPENLKMVLSTFSSVFPESSIWQSSRADIMLIGYKGPAKGLDYGLISKKLKGPAAWDLKAYLNISDPMDLFSYYIVGHEGIRALSENAGLNTDDRPFLEFNAPLSRHLKSGGINNYLLSGMLSVPQMAGIDDKRAAAAEFFYRKTVNYLRLGIPGRALWLKKALSMYPDNARYIAQYAMNLLADGKAREAMVLLNMNSPLLQQAPEYYYVKAMLVKDGNARGATEYLDRAISLKKNEFDYYYEAAKLNLETGDYEKAHDYFQSASELPHKVAEESRLFSLMGYNMLRLKVAGNAVGYFSKAVEANPYNYELMVQLADLYHGMGLSSRECELYKKILALPVEMIRDGVAKKRDNFCEPAIHYNMPHRIKLRS